MERKSYFASNKMQCDHEILIRVLTEKLTLILFLGVNQFCTATIGIDIEEKNGNQCQFSLLEIIGNKNYVYTQSCTALVVYTQFGL